MLRYLGSGTRRFARYPMYVHERTNWEFFAVLRGDCYPVFPDGNGPRRSGPRLWVFPPGVPHGWNAASAQKGVVAVFHFGTVPPLLERTVLERKWFDRALTRTEVRQIEQLEKRLRPHYQHMTGKSLLVFEVGLLELSLLALAGETFDRPEPRGEAALRKVEAVLTWYGEHMAEQPKLERVAGAVHLSVRHLRRLFLQARHETPQLAFTKLRLQRAMELLSNSDEKLDAIAVKCGFSSASDFCRVFKAYHKVSPDSWRREKLPEYREP